MDRIRQQFKDIADMIRLRNGTTDSISASEMPELIRTLGGAQFIADSIVDTEKGTQTLAISTYKPPKLPTFRSDGTLNFNLCTITGDFTLNEDKIVMPYAFSGNKYGELHFVVPKNGKLTVTWSMNDSPINYNTGHGVAISNLDTSVSGCSRDNISNKGVWCANSFYAGKTWTQTYDVTAGEHFISFNNYASYNSATPGINILSVVLE